MSTQNVASLFVLFLKKISFEFLKVIIQQNNLIISLGGSGAIWAVWTGSERPPGADWRSASCHSGPTNPNKQHPGAASTDPSPWSTLIHSFFLTFIEREERGERGIGHQFSTGKTNHINKWSKDRTNCKYTANLYLLNSYFFLAHSLVGTGTEDQRIPRADCLTKLKMQDAGSEGQACHHAADSERCGGTPWGGDGWREIQEIFSTSCHGKRTQVHCSYGIVDSFHYY